MTAINKNAKIQYGARLKALRKQADVSQENLAKAIGVHQPYIASIEAGGISIGIDKQEEIAAYFGMKYYNFANPDFPMPTKQELRERIKQYVKSTDTEPGYLKDETPNYSKYINQLLQTNFLSDPKTAREIATKFTQLYGLEISATRVSDILSRSPRKELVEIIKSGTGRRNVYRLKNN